MKNTVADGTARSDDKPNKKYATLAAGKANHRPQIDRKRDSNRCPQYQHLLLRFYFFRNERKKLTCAEGMKMIGRPMPGSNR